MAHIPFDSFVEAFHAVNKGTQSRIRMGQFMALMPRDHDWEAGCKVLHEYGDIFVERALKYQESWRTRGADVGGKIQDRYVFLQELAKQITDPKELRNQLLGILLVGSETTASLLAGCVSLLSNRPTLWTKLHKEAVDLGIPNNESVKAFTSLNYVINEVLRLYPILPVIGRMANKDTSLPVGGGPLGDSPVFIPKGTMAVTNTYALHRRPEVFGIDSDEFNPERWASMKTLGHWDFLPFGGGPRVCIGQQFAMMEVLYTLTRLLQVFPNIISRDLLPWRENISITLRNDNGAKVAFEGV